MAIRVKGDYAGGGEYNLFADTKAELSGAALVTTNCGTITCPAGTAAYTLAGEVLILSTAGVWTEVV